MRFKAVSIAGDTRVDIAIAGLPFGGTVAHAAHGNLGRELVRLANAELEREEQDTPCDCGPCEDARAQ